MQCQIASRAKVNSPPLGTLIHSLQKVCNFSFFVISSMINLPNPKELPGCFISVLIWHNFFDKGHFIQLIYRGDTIALKNARPLHSVMHTANMSNKPKNKYRFAAKVNQSSLGWGNSYLEITSPSILGENQVD